METLSTVLILSALSVAVDAVIPENYTLKVTPFCGKGAHSDARIEIITDLVIQAHVECAGGVKVDFTTTDNVNFHTFVSYPGQGSQPCVFMKKVNAMVFTVTVFMAYGEGPQHMPPAQRSPLVKGVPTSGKAPGLVHMEEERITVRCTFGPVGRGGVGKNIIEGCIAPSELFVNAGKQSLAMFNLEMVDVVHRSLANQDVHLGRTVLLKGVVSGVPTGVVGIRPVSCFAIAGTAAYAILRAGCGDGIVFPKTRGFSTTGLTTLSPYFLAFDINFADKITFKCHFVTCDTNCDGSSCKTERKRRAALNKWTRGDTIFANAKSLRGSSSLQSQLLSQRK